MELTNHGLDDPFSHLDELLVDLDGEVTQHLSVLRQVEVLQAVFVLFACVLCHKCLKHKKRTDCGPRPSKLWTLSCRWCSHLVTAVLFQTVQQSTGVGQPEGGHFKVVAVFLDMNHKDILQVGRNVW